MKNFIINIFLGLFFTTAIYADNSFLTMDEKIVLMLENERKISANREKIYIQERENPFKDKEYGVELNIPFLVFTLFPDITMISGTFSIFNSEKKTEIAFPFFIYSVTDEWENTADTKHDFVSLDIHYRKYIGEYLNGFYLSGFIRGSYIKGILGEDFMYEDGEELSGEYGIERKLGIGVGVGYRYFSKSAYYWGASLNIGKYITGTHGVFANDMFFEDSKIIFDLEFLKLGYAF